MTLYIMQCQYNHIMDVEHSELEHQINQNEILPIQLQLMLLSIIHNQLPIQKDVLQMEIPLIQVHILILRQDLQMEHLNLLHLLVLLINQLIFQQMHQLLTFQQMYTIEILYHRMFCMV